MKTAIVVGIGILGKCDTQIHVKTRRAVPNKIPPVNIRSQQPLRCVRVCSGPYLRHSHQYGATHPPVTRCTLIATIRVPMSQICWRKNVARQPPEDKWPPGPGPQRGMGGEVRARGVGKAAPSRVRTLPGAAADAGRLSPLPADRWLLAATRFPAPCLADRRGWPVQRCRRFFRRESTPSRALPLVASATAHKPRRPRLRPPPANPLAPIRLDGAVRGAAIQVMGCWTYGEAAFVH